MARSSPSEIIFISVNHSITLIGKVWLVVMIFLRLLLLLLAGYPLYQDEQERFVCNTIQPGCANVCYDIFSPVSLFRFWLVQLITLSLPYIIFTIYVIHKVSNGLTVTMTSLNPGESERLYKIQQELYDNASGKQIPKVERGSIQCFNGAYILQLMFRTLLEVGFAAAHYYMFGFYIPRRFLCQHHPCTTQVDCYISRPTEKTVMLNFMLGAAALSLFLNALDFICAIKRSVRQKSKVRESIYEDEHGFLEDPDRNSSFSRRILETEASQKGSFRKRQGSRGSCKVVAQGISQDATEPHPLLPLGRNTNGNNGYSASLEEALEKEGDELVLCPGGTPKAICVNKRRHKPSPPPRRDLGLHPGISARPKKDEPTATGDCFRRIDQYTLVALGSGAELSNDEGQEKRSEWV
ncbi:gap junction delta-4 protein [Corythoichthys intestinalis]|uniref:gap junction delta-4 protein n=1 Tax=Corythoichthys intestinalis TaxID=161448 RepID=UPI0025A65690|nr:gap junction delta-4 protein [Corythoichthys intestinalis]XP_061811602.1 gap junction delta-4 protein-like [Nerophis lumbriciformis]